MAWGNDPPHHRVSNSGWGIVSEKPTISLETIKDELEKAGTELTDAEDGDWIVKLNSATGLLVARGDGWPYVYTSAAVNSELCLLLTRLGVGYGESPTGGWAESD